MNRDKLIDRIKKLLSLAKSHNPNEAVAALTKARKLMNQYSISTGDLAVADILERQADTKHRSKTAPGYLCDLVGLCADLFSCHTYCIEKSNWKNGRRSYALVPVFIGYEIDVELAQYTYDNLYRKLSVARRLYRSRYWYKGDVTKDKDAYAEGWVVGVKRNVQHLVPPKHEVEVRAGAGALMVVDPVALYLKNLGIDDGLKTSRGLNDIDSMRRGLVDGRCVQVQKGTAAPKSKRIT